ncbi:MAG TPA: hypothetical protein VMF13_14545 [Luteitalea sp.]|nr:hypothetical protein [Luteitalea sp.]
MAMTSGAFIQAKQRAWAQRRGIKLQGSAGTRGAPNYTMSVEDNLFDHVLLPAVRTAFEHGAGGELRGAIPTMSALHSSAAMAVNLFQYWMTCPDTLTGLLGLPGGDRPAMAFEDCFPVCDSARARGFTVDPHLDFGLRYADGRRVGVECKMFEPYGRLSEKRLSAAYLALDSWGDISRCRALGERLVQEGGGFRRLDACQLLKHLLGLKAGVPSGKWTLIYLYLDAPGDEGCEHRSELRRFEDAVAADGIAFTGLSVQEFVLRGVSKARAAHEHYVDYLSERYL